MNVSHTIRRAVLVSLGISAILAAGGGIAFAHDASHHHDHSSGHSSSRLKHLSTQPEDSSPYASHAGDSHHPYGTGSGLSGGPTHTQVLPNGEGDVPLQDPTLGEGTLLPPGYNALAHTTGG